MKEHFEIEFRLPPNSMGWLDINLRCGESTESIGSSYLGHGLAEIIIAVIAFYQLGTSQSVLFELEPGRRVLRFDWSNRTGIVYVRTGHDDDLMVGWEARGDTNEPPDFEAICTRVEFLRAFSKAVHAAIDDVGLDEFNRLWCGSTDISIHHIALLKDLTSAYGIGETNDPEN
jgi:hypothetical protein